MVNIKIEVQQSKLQKIGIEILVIHDNGQEQTKHIATIDSGKGSNIKDCLPGNLKNLIDANIASNGDLILNNIISGITLDVMTTGMFINSSFLDLKEILIIAKEVKLQEKIQVANSLVVLSDKFENHANLAANSVRLVCANKISNFNKLVANKHIEVQGTADFVNEGIWIATEILSHVGHSIVNSGIINVGSARLMLHKLQTEQARALFSNDNLFLVHNKLSMTVNKMTVNTGKFIVLGEASFTLSSLYNKGEMAVNGKFYVSAKAHIINKKGGTILTTDRLRLSFRTNVGKLINLGSMIADVIAVRDCLDFINDLNAKFTCRDFQLPVNGLFFNGGLIYGKNKCILHLKNRSGLKSINTSDGKIISEQKIDLVVASNFSNYGQISGHKSVNGVCYGSLFNLQQGLIISEEALSLKATIQLVNDAEIVAKQTAIISQDLSNQANGSIVGVDFLEINGELLTNDGKLSSKKQVQLDIATLIKNCRAGIISSANQSVINCGLKIKNHGVLAADQFIDLHSDNGLITNTQDGGIFSPAINIDVQGITNIGNIIGLNVNSQSMWLINSGSILAKQLTARVQSIFINLQQGKIKVEKLAQIISESSLDNLGKLLSDNKLEIIGKEVYNYKGAHLFAEHFIYLEAVNLFAKGEIQSAGDLLLLVKSDFEYEDVVLQAGRELLLRLKDGSQVKYNINTPSDLKFEFLTKTGVLYNDAKLQSGGDLIINESGYVIINGQYSREALILAQKRLILDSKRLELQHGSLKADYVDLTSKQQLSVAQGAKIIGDDASMKVTEGIFQQHGELEFTGNVFINAKQQLALKGASKIGGVLQAIAEGNIIITESIEAQDIFIASLLDNVEIKSSKDRIGNTENFTEILQRARICAKNILQIIANKDVIFESIETESGPGGTHITAIANILDLPVDLVKQKVQHFYSKKCSGTIKDTWLEQTSSIHKTTGNFTSVAGADGVYFACKIQAKNAYICSGSDTKFMSVTSSHSSEVNLQGKKSTMFGSKRRTFNSSSGNVTTVGTNFAIIEQLRLDSKEDLELHQPISTARHNELSAGGEVAILHGRKSSFLNQASSSCDVMWNKYSTIYSGSEQYIAPEFSGYISIRAKSAKIEFISGKILEFLDRIKEHPEDLTYVALYEQYQNHHESDGSPGAGLISLIALATVIATQGTSSAWALGAIKASTISMSAGLASIVHAALTAGFQALMAKATTSMAANNFDVCKAIKDLASSGTLKELAVQMVSAGLMRQFAGKLDVPTKTSLQSTAAVSGNEALDVASKINMGQAVINQVLKAGVDSGLSCAVYHKDFEETLSDAIKSAATATTIAPITDSIDASFSRGAIDSVTRTITHMMAGAVSNITTNNSKGGLVGALEGLIAARLPGVVGSKDEMSEKFEKDQDRDKLNVPEQEEDLKKSKSTLQREMPEKIFSPQQDLQQQTRSLSSALDAVINQQNIEDWISRDHQSSIGHKITEKHCLIDSQAREALVRKISTAEIILDFFIPAACANELPQSIDNSSSSSSAGQHNIERVFNVFKSAVNGNPDAQLEMRRRVPIVAAFSDTVVSSYRSWNDPILSFKNKVHDKLGTSWFLPSSMDDLGEVCLNMSGSALAAASIPRAISFGKKMQFAYQAYRKTQDMANRSPSDPIQHEALKSLYRQNMEKPMIQNKDPILREMIDNLYRGDARVGSGSTADAARLEIATNRKVGGKWHVEKSQGTIKFLEKWLRNNPTASSSDRSVIENTIIDLKDALGKKPWYSQTKPPKP